jgi:hypothetical protein
MAVVLTSWGPSYASGLRVKKGKVVAVQAMQPNGEVEVHFHSFLISALDEVSGQLQA